MAIEIKITIGGEVLEHLAGAVHELAGAMKAEKPVSLHMNSGEVANAVKEAEKPVPAVPVSQPSLENVPPMVGETPTVQPAAVSAGQPTQNGPGQMPVQTVPTAPAVQDFTMEQISVAMTGLMERIGMPGIQEIMAQFGVQSLMEIPKEAYPQLVTVIRQKGGQI